MMEFYVTLKNKKTLEVLNIESYGELYNYLSRRNFQKDSIRTIYNIIDKREVDLAEVFVSFRVGDIVVMTECCSNVLLQVPHTIIMTSRTCSFISTIGLAYGGHLEFNNYRDNTFYVDGTLVYSQGFVIYNKYLSKIYSMPEGHPLINSITYLDPQFVNQIQNAMNTIDSFHN
jgi:hypothetical protein